MSPARYNQESGRQAKCKDHSHLFTKAQSPSSSATLSERYVKPPIAQQKEPAKKFCTIPVPMRGQKCLPDTIGDLALFHDADIVRSRCRAAKGDARLTKIHCSLYMRLVHQLKDLAAVSCLTCMLCKRHQSVLSQHQYTISLRLMEITIVSSLLVHFCKVMMQEAWMHKQKSRLAPKYPFFQP